MQRQTSAKRYIFDGAAIGVAGHIVAPYQETIEVQASSALPASGGVASNRVNGFRFKEIVSFKSAYTHVIGREAHEGVFDTLSISVVEGLNVLDVVTCDRMVARLTSTRDLTAAEPLIYPIGSRFENLRIGNRFYETLEVAPAYFCQPELASWSGLQRAVADCNERELLSTLSLAGRDGKAVALPADDKPYGLLGFCLALGPPTANNVLGTPLIFDLPQFGTVHLGEFFCYPTSRHLIMLRVSLGCPAEGELSACGAVVDGNPYPP